MVIDIWRQVLYDVIINLLEYAVKGEYSHAVIMGGDEYARGVVRLKNLGTREEKEVVLSDLQAELNA